MCLSSFNIDWFTSFIYIYYILYKFSPEWGLTYRYRQVLSHLHIQDFHKHASQIIPASGYETFWLLANWQVLFTWPRNCPTPQTSWTLKLEIMVYPTQPPKSAALPLILGVSWISMFKFRVAWNPVTISMIKVFCWNSLTMHLFHSPLRWPGHIFFRGSYGCQTICRAHSPLPGRLSIGIV